MRGLALWARWRRLAHRAAVVQSNVLLFLLYFLLVVPVSVLMRVRPSRPNAGWQPVEPSPSQDLDAARRQF